MDVHVRRLRAKLGPEREPLIGTVRGVGYKMVPPPRTVPGTSRPARRHELPACRPPPRHRAVAGRYRALYQIVADVPDPIGDAYFRFFEELAEFAAAG